MKKIGFLLLFVTLSLMVFAQSGTLLISSSNNQHFWLFIDDILQNEYSIPSIKITGMQPKQYKIRVEMDNANSNCIGQLIAISNQYYGESYVVFYRNNNYVIAKTQSNVRPLLVQNLIQPNYNYYNDYYQYLYPGFGNPGNYWQGNGGNHGKPYQYYQHPNQNHGGHHGNNNPPNVNPHTPPPPPTPPGGHHGGGNPGNHGNNATTCRNPVEFAAAMSSISKESFESGKLQFAKNMTVSGPICTEQIMQICNTFSFENTKLEYAKFAYAYCTDKNLYYMVNNVFQYQSSKDELSKFIR